MSITRVASFVGLKNGNQLFATGAAWIRVSGGGAYSLIDNRCPIIGPVDRIVQEQVFPSIKDQKETVPDTKSLIVGMWEWIEWVMAMSAPPTLFVTDTPRQFEVADFLGFLQRAMGKEMARAPRIMTLDELVHDHLSDPDRAHFERWALTARAQTSRKNWPNNPHAMAHERAELAAAVLRSAPLD